MNSVIDNALYKICLITLVNLLLISYWLKFISAVTVKWSKGSFKLAIFAVIFFF